ncbi:MAG TPA: GAF domain-containing sensor histidine kinase [Cytophagales bacterium]|nr:GAF domain-containing sensor histidine kinase [Cytophagales bacterium]
MEIKSQFASESKKEEYLKIIADFSMSLIEQTTIDEVVWDIAKNVSLALGFYDCIIYLYDEKMQVLVQKAAFGPKNQLPFQIKNPIILPLGVGIVGSVGESKVAEVVNDTRLDPRYVVDDEFRLSEITVPIVFEGKLLGIIDSEHPDTSFFTNEHLEILQIIASMSANKIIQANVFESLQYQTERLKISNNRLLQFAYIASHDLRSPASNIVTLLSFLDLSKVGTENLLFLEYIKHASEKLLGNLNHLIEMVTDETNLLQNKERIEVDKLLDEVKQSICREIEISHAVIKSNFKVATIQYPSVYLNSILLNLITNSIKYRSPKRALVIEIKTESIDEFVCLSVKDNGKGIDLNKNKLKIFGRLERFDPESEGKGLGLYLIKLQVEASGGKIEVESEVDEGAVFKVFLPAKV